jgi:FkbM family methyltransferase
MLGLGRVKRALHTTIAAHRRAAPVKMLHKVTAFIESAYANEGSDFATNGEKVLLQKLRSRDMRLAVDVGANVGDWTVEALAAWPRCQVHAFEVAPKTFEELGKRLKPAPGFERVVLNPVGCSDADGSQVMYYFPDHPDLTCDLPRHAHRSLEFDAKVVTLDRYCRERKIDHVDFLKMDVEGAEHRVLKGFKDYLASGKVDCIQFEYGAFATQTRFLLGDYYAMLSKDYWIGKIYPGYVDFRNYDWTMEDFKFSNYFCLAKTKPELKALLAS